MNREPLQMESCEPPAALNALPWPVAAPKNRVGGSAAFSFAFAFQFIGEPFDPNTLLPSTLSYYGYDGHGNVRFLMDTNGAVTDTYQYDAFGNLLNSDGSTPNDYLYCGLQYHTVSGLYNNRARRLFAPLGRFTTMDTFAGNNEDPLSLHKYLYGQDDPVNGTDPSGHDFTLVGTFSAVSIGTYLEAAMLTAITTAIAVDEIQQNRTLEYVYHYDKIPGMLLFPPGTLVTDDPTLSWSRALSITFATNPRYLYVYQLKVRPADLGPELDPVMGPRQWQLENTVFSFSMIKVLSPGQGD